MPHAQPASVDVATARLTRRAAAGVVGCLCLTAGTLAAVPGVSVAARFPARPVRLLVPFAAAQGSDLLARTLASELAVPWGQPVVVENKPGANGSLAVQELMRSPNDGHALLVSSNAPVVINPSLYRRLPYRPGDLQPLVPLARASLAIVVNPSLGVHTLGELIALLKSRPGQFRYGSPGKGSTSHMATAVFAQAVGAELVHLPYKGSGAALTDLIGGQLHLMIDALPSCLPHVRSGRLLALAVTGDKPSMHAPRLPTCQSQGVHGLPAGGWYGVFLRANTATGLSEHIASGLRSVVQAPAFSARLQEQAFEPLELDLAGFRQLVRDDRAFWELTTRRLNLYQQE